jgi:periplasmic divalent cation tolerance protein
MTGPAGTGVCQVTTTVGAAADAEALAGTAVADRLAACAQIAGPIRSVYWWDGSVDTAEEWYVVFKTTVDRYEELAGHIRERHTYDVPEIVVTPVSAGHPAYLQWVRHETRPG